MFLYTDHSGLNKFQGEHDDNFQLFLPEVKKTVLNAVGHCANGRKQIGKILLPYPQDKDFVPRIGTIDRVEEILGDTSSAPRAALVGFGGVG